MILITKSAALWLCLLLLCISVTTKARKTIKCELNVPYGPTERTKYDIYGTDLPKGM